MKSTKFEAGPRPRSRRRAEEEGSRYPRGKRAVEEESRSRGGRKGLKNTPQNSKRKGDTGKREKKARPSPGTKRDILDVGRDVISLEIEGLQEMLKHIGEEFTAAVNLIL
ncbi:MAG: hypothetical protein JXB45_04605, partial [Candidatus Krumholzibacteriota bacterium]|nr:hypothetical protein [Candidatus Krumholzibacteriota bacterium]